jgi:hypothetical protein
MKNLLSVALNAAGTVLQVPVGKELRICSVFMLLNNPASVDEHALRVGWQDVVFGIFPAVVNETITTSVTWSPAPTPGIASATLTGSPRQTAPIPSQWFDSDVSLAVELGGAATIAQGNVVYELRDRAEE